MRPTQRRKTCVAHRIVAALIAGIVLTASQASALIDGIVNNSGKSAGLYCISCHINQVGIPPLVAFEAPGGTEIAPGAIATFRFRITSRVASQTHAGLNVAAEAGQLSATEAGTQALRFLGLNEITHTMPRPNSNGVTVFEFTWRAPDTAGTYTLFGAGNSVNNNGTSTGDNAARTTIDIMVIAPPTATPRPSGTPTSTSTPSATASATPPPTVTATPPMAACVGDCDGDGQVTVDEIVTGVSIALGTLGVDRCPAFDRDQSGTVTVDELVEAIQRALLGCASP
jgi:hypothetical protein